MHSLTSSRQKHKPLIMLVDDIVRNLQLIADHLVSEGYEVSFATSGKQALDIVDDVMPDLILLDVMMPDMNGYEVCENIKNNSLTANIPVIFLTAKTDTEDILNGFKAGGVDYVTKPFRKDEILARIRTHLELKFAQELLKDHAEKLNNANLHLERELQSAAEYVRSLIPNQVDNDRYQIQWDFVPSEQLGGDSFGYHDIDDDKTAFYLLDVSGHGISSALFSVSILNNIRLHTLPDTDFSDPSSVFKALNKVYQINEHGGLYFTIWYGVFNSKTRILRFASAGHPPPLLLVNETKSMPLNAPNFIVGGLPKYNFDSRELEILPDSQLYVFSDGCFDFKKNDGSYWSVSELYSFLKKNSAHMDVLKELFLTVKNLQGTEKLKDDLSIMKIRFK